MSETWILIHFTHFTASDFYINTLEILRYLLEPCGAKVAIAATAAEGWGALEKFSQQVMIPDVCFRGEEGDALMSRPRQLRVSIRPAARHCIDLLHRTRPLFCPHGWLRAIIAKPFDEDELIHAIQV